MAVNPLDFSHFPLLMEVALMQVIDQVVALQRVRLGVHQHQHHLLRPMGLKRQSHLIFHK